MPQRCCTPLFGLRIFGLGFGDSNFGFRVSGFGLGLKVYGVWFRVSGVGLGGDNIPETCRTESRGEFRNPLQLLALFQSHLTECIY